MDELRSKLFYQRKNGYDLIDTPQRLALEDYAKAYISFLNDCRTEREAVTYTVSMAEELGFVPYRPGMALQAGDKIYHVNRGKALTLAVIGKRSLADGAAIVGAHIDSPSLHLKQMPLYETDEMCYLQTHYYGGIKKYQWVTIPLELHGAVALKSGEVVPVVIGREPGDPRFVITDLLPHLAKDQMQKTMAEGITGEGLHLLIGSTPYADDGKDRVKLAVMSLLNDMYGITEEDFLSAELMAVPAFEVSELGLDRSMVGGYGQDDRVCAFAGIKAVLDVSEPERTCVCVLIDKEEIGSEGVTGMQSADFDTFMADLCEGQGVSLRRCMEKSFCISADVTSAYDPLYPEVSDKHNDAKLNYGVAINKYTGARGKSSANDASAETVAYLRRLFEREGVVWQMAQLGKVDQGGGGTIAKFMARRNIETVDVGVPLLSMHAPYETSGKMDGYMTYRAFLALFSDK